MFSAASLRESHCGATPHRRSSQDAESDSIKKKEKKEEKKKEAVHVLFREDLVLVSDLVTHLLCSHHFELMLISPICI